MDVFTETVMANLITEIVPDTHWTKVNMKSFGGKGTKSKITKTEN